MLGLVFKKLPILAGLPLVQEKKFDLKPILLKLAEKIKTLPFLKNFSFEIFLQKVLSKIRVLIMKVDNKTFHWLQTLRENAQKNKFGENDNYWKEIKNSANEIPKISGEKRQRKKRLPT